MIRTHILNAPIKSKILGLEEQIGKLKKLIEKNELLGKFKEFLKSLESVSMAERIGAAKKKIHLVDKKVLRFYALSMLSILRFYAIFDRIALRFYAVR